MDRQELQDLLINSGADAVGFGIPRVFEEVLPALLQRNALPFEQSDVWRRINPFLHFPEAKGIVCILKGHGLYHNDLDEGQFKTTSSSIIDYHREIRAILLKAKERLMEDEIQSVVMCDTEGLLDKQIAVEAGLGFLGKNSLLIHPKLGSAVHIGYLLTACSWAPDELLPFACANCTRCIDACPKGALCEEGRVDPLRCLSGVSQNRRAEPQYLHRFLYGCDICLRACPYNVVEERDERFIYQKEDFDLSHKAFERLFGEKEFAWLGRNHLRRNIKWNEEEQ